MHSAKAQPERRVLCDCAWIDLRRLLVLGRRFCLAVRDAPVTKRRIQILRGGLEVMFHGRR